jgi:hypothetical protein
MPAPVWLGATTGQLPTASQMDAGLVTHPSSIVYTGASVAVQSTAGSGSTASNGLYIAQSFTTGTFTTAGRVVLTMTTTGTPVPTTIQLQTNNAGAPSGTVVTSTVIPPGWANASVVGQSIPLPASGLSASTTYWIVMKAAGDASDFYSWFKSNQTSGASTSTNGTAWTAQTYGLLYQVFDLSVVLPLLHTWEDSGARITRFFPQSATSPLPANLEEYTVAQGSNQFVYSFRSLGYSGGSVTSIS